MTAETTAGDAGAVTAVGPPGAVREVPRAHVEVLRAVQNHTVTTERMRARGRLRETYGQILPTTWHRRLDARVEHQHALVAAAAAGGIPQRWIHQVVARGMRGTRWHRDLYLTVPERVQRERLLTELRVHAQRMREFTAIAAGYGEWGARSEPGTASMFDRNLRAIWRRTIAVAHLLDPHRTHADMLWGSADAWVRAAADSARRHDTLEARWRHAARLDTAGFARQAAALADLGFPTDTVPDHLTSPADTVQRIRDLLTHHSIPASIDVTSPGAAIGAAVDASGLTTDRLDPAESGPAAGPPPIDADLGVDL
ncbi:hypothetical protein [Nocardia blacklockiae]|uniref:hypothetical protein n=1 Tax=Nocardia blacklockiae TaxID=480036 RepID=UPI001895AEA2|nr:hypothetical protein [Nocardia blacklockiae]MBF6176042.1 hypothetical protein [Nocardia blacklockiae]